MPEYLMIMLGFIFLTFFLHKKFKIKLFENNKKMFIFWAILYAFGVSWDSFAIYRGHWVYPGTGLLGIYIGLMPLEDYLFIFTCIYFSLILYKILHKD